MTDNERKELYRDRFYDMDGEIRWVFFDDHNGEGDHITVYFNYFCGDHLEEATKHARADETAFDWLLSEVKQFGEDYYFSNPSEEEAAYAEALADLLSYDEQFDLLAKDCTADTLDILARHFGARICSQCGEMHYEGYYVADTYYFCSADCLYANYEPDTYEEMYENDDAFWTQWFC